VQGNNKAESLVFQEFEQRINYLEMEVVNMIRRQQDSEMDRKERIKVLLERVPENSDVVGSSDSDESLASLN
jgi:hypothetical protein